MTSSKQILARMNITDIERETGLRKDTLRVWERRYGFPTPTRDEQGDRVYDSSQLQRLRLIKQLLDAGHRPGGVVGLSADELLQLASKARPATVTPKPEALLTQECLALLRNSDADGLRAALRRHILQHGLAQSAGEWIPHLGHSVGDAWQKQTLTVYQEHLFSDVVQSVLRESLTTIDQHPGPARPPTVLLTTLPNELHATGLLVAECFFALEKCQRRALGVSTPINDIVEAAQHMQIDLVALSISSHAAVREVQGQLRQLRQQLPETIELWVGGTSAALRSKHLPAGVLPLISAKDITAHIAAWRQAHP